jgi:GNAT superfamily N-acetyltransferase
MSKIEIRKISVSEMEKESNLKRLLKDYAGESAIAGLPPPVPNVDIYRRLESNGSYHGFGAFCDGELVGFFMALWTVNPHYGVHIAFMESFFVAKAYRRTGAAMHLLDCAERYFRGLKSPGFFVTAPVGSVLEKMMRRRRGYRQTNSVFLTVFNYE